MEKDCHFLGVWGKSRGGISLMRGYKGCNGGFVFWWYAKEADVKAIDLRVAEWRVLGGLKDLPCA